MKKVKLRKKKRKRKTQYGEEKLALINQKWNDMYGQEDPSASCYLWFEDEVAQVHKKEGDTCIRFSEHVGCEYIPKENTGRTLKNWRKAKKREVAIVEPSPDNPDEGVA